MKDKTKENIIFVSLYGLLVFSSLGAMVGTYAWFEYNSRIKTEWHGTAINRASGALKVGLYSEVELPEAEEHGLTKDGYYYWASEGLNHETLNYFLSACGYASNKIFPLTSGQYETNGQFALKSNPLYLTHNNNVKAKKHSYIYLPLVFASGNHEYIDIKLTEAKLESTSTLKEAIRMHFDLGDSNFTFAPHYNENGEDVVGGALDLNRDGYIDYNETTMEEYIYGDVANASYKTTANPNEGSPLPIEKRNCFNGKHYEGTYSLSEETVLKTSQYLGKKSVIGNKNVAYMKNGYARADLTIYAEGWASSLIDQIQGEEFNLDLSFSVY